MKELIGTTTVAVPVINEVTDDGIITALGLENTVIFGLTYGAWFKLGLFVALILLILERSLSIRSMWKVRKLRGK